MVPRILTWPGGSLLLDRPRVLGILNITPDSFSDGGRFFTPEAAVRRAFEIADEGADVLDVGAQSTRPGAEAVSAAQERERLFPVLRELKSRKFPLPVSLDCAKPDLVEEALGGRLAQIVNDVEGLRNPGMARVVKKYPVPVILMHMFGSPRTMQQEYRYDDVVKDLISFFRARLSEAGIAGNVVLDPGLGFGKSVEHNLEIVRRLGEFEVLGHPLLIGASRKSFIGKILGTEVPDRLEGSLAVAALAVANGASLIRAHDVRPTVRAVRVAEAVAGKRPERVS